nr:hypothetical protein CFP56_04852 [Quercus suber]
MKKKANPSSNLIQGSKPPMVVVQFEKPLPKVDLNEEGNVSLNVTYLEEKIGAGKNFKETLEILNKDFNEILRGHEKLGGLPRREVELEAFRDVVDELGFVDLGYTGRKYTWRCKKGDTMILERLDGAFANSTWLEIFPATRVQHLHSNASNHKPMIIKPKGIVQCKNKPFCFNSMWMKEDGCRATIVDAWGYPSYDSSMILASSKIKHCGEKLVEWSQTSFGSIKSQLAEATKKLVLTEEAAARGSSYE